MEVLCVPSIIGEGHLGYGYTIEKARADLEPLGFRLETFEDHGPRFYFWAAASSGTHDRFLELFALSRSHLHRH